MERKKMEEREEMGREMFAEGVPLGGRMELSQEEERQARIGVITNVAAFAAIVFALRIGKGSTTAR